MKKLVIDKFCGYDVILNEELRSDGLTCLYYSLDTDIFYNQCFDNSIRGRILSAANYETLRVLGEAFQQLIINYYKAFGVKVFLPENGECAYLYVDASIFSVDE